MAKTLDNYSIMSPVFTVTEVETKGSRSNIVIEPLENGYGHTIGNALRRVLLTSLPGIAITKLSIEGISHQFSTYEGLKEDIVDLILNLKRVRIKSDSDEAGVLRLNVKGAKEITAKDIECEAGFEVINKDLYLATLAKDKTIEIEMIVESGLGYKLAKEIEIDNVGQIALDALFSPVIKVAYHVEATRVGSRTDFDRIVFDIQTDASVTPLEAIERASSILIAQFKQIVNPIIPEVEEELPAISPEELEIMRLTVEELDLPTRIANALRKGGYETVKNLLAANKNEISKVKNLGGKSIDLIEEALSKKGVVLPS